MARASMRAGAMVKAKTGRSRPNAWRSKACTATPPSASIWPGPDCHQGQERGRGSNVIKAKIQTECREKEGMNGGITKDEYGARRSTVTQAKVEAISRKEKGIHGGQTKDKYTARGQH